MADPENIHKGRDGEESIKEPVPRQVAQSFSDLMTKLFPNSEITKEEISKLAELYPEILSTDN